MRQSWRKVVLSMLAFGLTVLYLMELVTPAFDHLVFKSAVVCIGGLAGWLWQKYIFFKVVEKLKKVPSHEILLKGLSFLFGLSVAVLFSIILKP